MDWKKVLGALSPVVALFITSITTSCSGDNLTSDDDTSNEKSRTVTLTANVDDNNSRTRVGMNKETADEVSFYWHKDDKILVQTKSGDTFSGTTFTITGDDAKDGDTKVNFTGEVTGTVGTYAVYPYSEDHKHAFDANDATKLTYNLPATYTYTTVEGNIFPKNGTYPTNSTNMPMLGNIADGNITFKHLGGLAVIRIDKMPAESGTLTVTADKQLSGDFAVDLFADTPVITTVSTDTDADKQVVFTFSGATEGDVGVFYLPLATGNYSGVTIVISSTDNTTNSTIKYGALDVSRATVTAIPLYNNSGKVEKYVQDADGKYTINGHKFVDLGLPSGLLWAETNVGANSATEYGNYYAWGEVTAYGENTDWGEMNKKEYYCFSTYKWTGDLSKRHYDLTKYTIESHKYTTDGKTVLDKEDDAAYVNWGSSCRMPTKYDCEELLSSENCTWTRETNNGYKVTSKKQGYTSNSIFFPAAGYREDNELNVQGYGCGFWSSSLSSPDYYAYQIFYSYIERIINYDFRHCGYPVRPVAEK